MLIGWGLGNNFDFGFFFQGVNLPRRSKGVLYSKLHKPTIWGRIMPIKCRDFRGWFVALGAHHITNLSNV